MKKSTILAIVVMGGGVVAFSGCANSQLQNTNIYNTQKYQNAHAKCGNSHINAHLESRINAKLRQKIKSAKL